MGSLNYWYRMLKYNKDFKSAVKVILFILITALLIYLISDYFFINS